MIDGNWGIINDDNWFWFDWSKRINSTSIQRHLTKIQTFVVVCDDIADNNADNASNNDVAADCDDDMETEMNVNGNSDDDDNDVNQDSDNDESFQFANPDYESPGDKDFLNRILF